MFPKALEQFYHGIENFCRARGYIAGKSGRHMKYPYTLSAKIAQFPLFFYMRKNWIWMYYPLGWVVGLYCFSFIHAAVNSEANKKNWADTQRKLAEAEHH